MHDVGRLALTVLQPREYAALLESHSGSARSILKPERELFGFDHCEAGRRLVADWKLPSSFSNLVADHHAPKGRELVWGMPAMINLSCRIADTVGFAVFPGCETLSYEDLLDELPARERKVFQTNGADLGLEIASNINAIERA